jgi:LemA protein
MYIFYGICAFILVLTVLFYNRLVRYRFLMNEGWSGIDVQLKRRHDLIPNLVEMVKAYAGHEKQTLEDVTKLRDLSRNEQDISQKSGIENNISNDLKKVFALVESYPNLKADQNFRKLQDSLTEIEDSLQYARRYYNGTVRDYNIGVQSFPSNILAQAFGFKSAAFFEIEYATERQTPDIKF